MTCRAPARTVAASLCCVIFKETVEHARRTQKRAAPKSGPRGSLKSQEKMSLRSPAKGCRRKLAGLASLTTLGAV